jgi:hypothetical protein
MSGSAVAESEPARVRSPRRRINYSAAGLEITHLAGQAYGTIIANQRNGVSIDTSTRLDLTLRNATPSNLGSAMLRVDGLASYAGMRLTH